MNHEKFDASRTGEQATPMRRARNSRYRKEGDSAKKRRWLFLLADVFLLIAVVAAVFFLVVLLTPLDLFAGEGTEERAVVYTVEFAGVDSTLLGTLQVGDEVTDAETGSVIGVVTEISNRRYEVFTDIPSAEMDEALNSYVVTKNTYPDSYTTLSVTIRATAEYTPGVGYVAEDCRIAVGRAYDLRFPAYTGEGVCVSFSAVSRGEEVAQ